MSFQKIYGSQPNTALESEGRGGEGRGGTGKLGHMGVNQCILEVFLFLHQLIRIGDFQRKAQVQGAASLRNCTRSPARI